MGKKNNIPVELMILGTKQSILSILKNNQLGIGINKLILFELHNAFEQEEAKIINSYKPKQSEVIEDGRN